MPRNRRPLTSGQIVVALVCGTVTTVLCFAVLAGGIVYLITGGW